MVTGTVAKNVSAQYLSPMVLGCHCDYTFYKRSSIFTCFDAQRNDHRLLYWTGSPGVCKETAKDLKSEVFLTAKFTIRHMTREQ